MEVISSLDATTLRNWLENGKPVTILDVRTLAERQEWAIPSSQHVDVYDKLKAGDKHALDAVKLPQNVPVVTVCAAGRMSLRAAGQLQEKGLEVYSLKGGMKAWSLAWNTAKVTTTLAEVSILQIRRTGKGCLSYIVASGGEALVIDASLDERVYIGLAMRQRWQIKYVLDTHLHADHLSRARVLAGQTGATLLLPKSDKFQFSYQPVTSQTSLPLGKTTLKAISTPGHTLESFSYLVGESVLFTGDTLFVDGIGRPDLKASPNEIRQKAGLLYQSIHKLLALPQSLQVLPGHTSRPVAFDEEPIVTTIGKLVAKLSWVKVSEEEFAERVLAKIPATPPNYLTISELNGGGEFSGVDPLEMEAGANRCAIS
jgi:glyoxylase-like metal-dependent hydrolase (beta-lactamase superfamily II)/rhodanese-related sulfurtransferase